MEVTLTVDLKLQLTDPHIQCIKAILSNRLLRLEGININTSMLCAYQLVIL